MVNLNEHPLIAELHRQVARGTQETSEPPELLAYQMLRRKPDIYGVALQLNKGIIDSLDKFLMTLESVYHTASSIRQQLLHLKMRSELDTPRSRRLQYLEEKLDQAFFNERGDKTADLLSSLVRTPQEIRMRLRTGRESENSQYHLTLTHDELIALRQIVSFQADVFEAQRARKALSQVKSLQKTLDIIAGITHDTNRYDALKQRFDPTIDIARSDNHLENIARYTTEIVKTGAAMSLQCSLPIADVDGVSIALGFSRRMPLWIRVPVVYKGAELEVRIQHEDKEKYKDITVMSMGKETILDELASRLQEYLDCQLDDLISPADHVGRIRNIRNLPDDAGIYANCALRVLHLLYQPERPYSALFSQQVNNPQEDLGIGDAITIYFDDFNPLNLRGIDLPVEDVKTVSFTVGPENYLGKKITSRLQEEQHAYLEQMSLEQMRGHKNAGSIIADIAAAQYMAARSAEVKIEQDNVSEGED